MISILIVDDNAEKIKAIKEAIYKIPLIDENNFTIATDKNSAKKFLMEFQFDLMILDISLPERFGDIPDDKGGVDFLKEINMDPEFAIPFHIIGITAYPNLKEQHNEVFSLYLWHLIVYEEEYGSWKNKLYNHVTYLIKSKEEIRNPSNVNYEYDLAIITILSLELRYVKELPCNWIEEKFDNDDNYYYTGYVMSNGKKIKIVATSTNNNMGMSAAATIAMKTIDRFKPRYISMIGICAGIEGKGNIGDPIIADKVWDYGSGKYDVEIIDSIEKEVFKPYINQIALESSLNSALTKAIDENLFVSEIQYKWHQKYPTTLKAILGPFASGSAVIANEHIVNSIKLQHGQLLGFDMESYGVFYAAQHCQKPKPIPFCIKSISDYGNANKNNPQKDAYQAYAAYTSAHYFFQFIIKYLS